MYIKFLHRELYHKTMWISNGLPQPARRTPTIYQLSVVIYHLPYGISTDTLKNQSAAFR